MAAISKHPLEKLKETIQFASSQLNEDIESSKSNNFNLEQFWTNYVASSKLISHEATKLSVSTSKPPVPSLEEYIIFSDCLEKAILALLTSFLSFPKEYGSTIRKVLKTSVINILKSVETLCTEAMNIGSNTQLISIGNVWEQCNEVPKLPRDNKSAVLKNSIEQLDMVKDALQELEDSLNESTEYEDSEWSEVEKQLLPFSRGLVKASKVTLKKSKIWLSSFPSSSNTPVANKVLDELSSLIIITSSHVDDFVLSVYAPINHGLLRRNAANLMENNMKILDTIKATEELCPECDISWLDFLRKALQHNFDKIEELALED